MIHIWHNKQTNSPSIELGLIKVDLTREETTEQRELFKLVVAHPEAIAQPHFQCPLTPEIAEAFEAMVHVEVQRQIPKRVGQQVEFHIE